MFFLLTGMLPPSSFALGVKASPNLLTGFPKRGVSVQAKPRKFAAAPQEKRKPKGPRPKTDLLRNGVPSSSDTNANYEGLVPEGSYKVPSWNNPLDRLKSHFHLTRCSDQLL